MDGSSAAGSSQLAPESLVEAVAAMEVTNHKAVVPPHLSHDPETNMKRSDPFQFGQRYLEKDDDVFEYNAWDHVEPDEAFYAYAEEQYEKQRQSPVSDFDKRKSHPLPPLPGVPFPDGFSDDLQVQKHSSSESK